MVEPKVSHQLGGVKKKILNDFLTCCIRPNPYKNCILKTREKNILALFEKIFVFVFCIFGFYIKDLTNISITLKN
jgi:hypothetical protein